MHEYLAAMAMAGELKPPKHTLVPLEDFKEAVTATMTGFKEGKFILDLRGDAK